MPMLMLAGAPRRDNSQSKATREANHCCKQVGHQADHQRGRKTLHRRGSQEKQEAHDTTVVK